jgi:CRISPR-associated exonuclease Cas4
MFYEDDLLPLSLLQHLAFCERRAALVYLESIWDENVFTIEGGHLHKRAHCEKTEVRGKMRIARGLRIHSLKMGLVGMADVVEFHRIDNEMREKTLNIDTLEGVTLPGVTGRWQPFPVEYKRGHKRHEKGYELQLCGQAICLEEMLGVEIKMGAIFYGKSARRMEIPFQESLRRETEAAVNKLHDLIRVGASPPAHYEKKCESCSLMKHCMPKTNKCYQSASQYILSLLAEQEKEKDEAIT